jgi:hypothetical protein
MPNVIVSATASLARAKPVVFDAAYERRPPALLETAGNIYDGFGSFCDIGGSIRKRRRRASRWRSHPSARPRLWKGTGMTRRARWSIRSFCTRRISRLPGRLINREGQEAVLF